MSSAFLPIRSSHLIREDWQGLGVGGWNIELGRASLPSSVSGRQNDVEPIKDILVTRRAAWDPRSTPVSPTVRLNLTPDGSERAATERRDAFFMVSIVALLLLISSCYIYMLMYGLEVLSV